MSKLHRVINNEGVEIFNVRVGDICALETDDRDGTAWFKNSNWGDDGIWCLEWSMVEEVVEEK